VCALLLTLAPRSPARAAPTRVIDLLPFGAPSGELTRIYGSSGDGLRGVPVAGGGDVDDDGSPDSAFAAVQASPLGRMGAGEVIVVFGDGTIGGTLTTANLGPGLLKIAGQHEMEVAGVEIEIADVTGDGVEDLLIGRQNHTPEVARPGAGALTILVGGPELREHAETLAYLDLGAIPGAITATTIVGASSYDRFGLWMRAGDVDGDDVADIVVGADEVDKTVGMTLEQNRGAVYVIRGGAHLAATQTIDLALFGTMSFPVALAGKVALLEPPAGSDHYHLGATCQVGDLDGDDKAEVLAAAALSRSNAGLKLPGAPAGTGESSGGPPQGEVFIAWDDFFPTTAWPSGYTIDLGAASMDLTRLRGSAVTPTNGELGEEMLAGLDYDGDGALDLFLGDLTGDPGSRPVAGIGHVFFGAAALEGVDADLDDLLAAPPAGLRHTYLFGPSSVAIGADTAVHGDYDGDGLADLAMCNPKDDPQGRSSAGTVHVLYGEIGGWPPVIDLLPASLPSSEAVRIVELQGAVGDAEDPVGAGDTLCYSAAGGDVDADGVPDLLINEMEGNGFAADGPDPDADLDPAPDVGNLLVVDGASLLQRVLLDFDGDGEANPLTDGMLLLRYLLGSTGDDLTDGVVGEGATRSVSEIEKYLAQAGAALDADGDDALEASNDGELALRFLFEFRDSTLTDDAIGDDATRTTPGEIADFLDRLVP
jgi:hypothetical protein